MPQRNLIESFNCAIKGCVYVLRSQRNMKLHLLTAIIVILFGIWSNLNRTEILILCGTITFVLLTEMFNTAMELAVDLTKDIRHPLARMVKDITAGAVLIASINALVVGYLLFIRPTLAWEIERGIDKVKGSPWHVTLIVLIAVLSLTILMKVVLRKGTPLRGGMPSGHTALAFCVWTISAFLSENHLVTILVLVIALLLAKSRLRESLHNKWEVMAGALLGILVTTLIFQFLG